MIIHIDSDNPKPIEQKVRELILQKLFIKVDDSKIYIDKEVFIDLILQDVTAIAKANYNIDKALKIAIKEQPRYKTIPDVKRNELEEAVEEFGDEIDAYRNYLDLKKEEVDDLKIFDQVRFILNSDEDFLEKKLYDLMVDSVGLKISVESAIKMGADRQLLLETYANYVKVIAKNDTIDDAAEELYFNNEAFFRKNKLKSDFIKGELEKFAPALEDEIKAYKFALNLYSQGADFAMILATVNQLLQLDQE